MATRQRSTIVIEHQIFSCICFKNPNFYKKAGEFYYFSISKIELLHLDTLDVGQGQNSEKLISRYLVVEVLTNSKSIFYFEFVYDRCFQWRLIGRECLSGDI